MTHARPSITTTCRFLSDPRLNGRYPGSAGHEEAKRYLLDILPNLELEPLFDGSWTQDVHDRCGEPIGANLGGFRRGSSDRSILIGAHYDHLRGIPGADDNAAAVSIVIDTARQLAPWDGVHDLVICFFDLEEPPYFCTPQMGCVQFVERCPVDLTKMDCAIILDLCGHDVPAPALPETMFVLGAEYSQDLVDLVRSQQTSALPTGMFANSRIGDMSDHHAFRGRDVPFLFFSCGWWEHYHAPSDTFEHLNLDKMQVFADYLVGLVRALDERQIELNPVEDFESIEAQSLSRIGTLPETPDPSAVEQVMNALIRQMAF